MGISRCRVAKNIHVPQRRIDLICRGEAAVSADMVLRLGRLFGTTPEFWISLEAFPVLGDQDCIVSILHLNQQVAEVLARTPPSCYQSESGNRKMVIEGECEANARALHDGKTRCVHGRKLVQVLAPEVFPGYFQVAQLAGKDLHGPGFMDRRFPRQCYVTVGIAVQESESLDYDRDGRV